MNSLRPYHPQPSRIPADIIRGDSCDTWRSMNPLTGICSACTTVPGYIYASPNGEKIRRAMGHRAVVPPGHGGCGNAFSYRALAPAGAGNVGFRQTANYSLLTANWTYTFSAKEPTLAHGITTPI